MTKMGTSNLEFVVKEKHRIESFAKSGQLDKARKIAEKLCRKQRNDAECWFLLGVVCGQQGDFSRAIECCKRTVKLAPNVAVANLNLGVALHSAGRLKEAVPPLIKAAEIQSDLVSAYRELGFVYNELGDYSQSIKKFKEYVCFRSNDQPVWLILGNLYEKQQDMLNAEACYRKSFEIDPGSIAAGVNLGNVLKMIGRPGDAEEVYNELLSISENNPDVFFNLAVLYQSLYRYEEAEIYYQKVIDIQPANNAALLNLGVVCLALFQYKRAIKLFSQILKADPDSVDARRSLSAVYKELNQLDQAKEQLLNILEVIPDDIKTRQDLSLILLQQGDFLRGWQEYEWRNRNVDGAESRWPYPVWTNRETSIQTVLVYPEQGIGDEIMFSSCINDFSSYANIVLACDKRLEPLFRRSFPSVQVIGRKSDDADQWLCALPHIDTQISIASLPLYLRACHDDFFSGAGYLVADHAMVEKWRTRYSELDGRITVGISWKGGHEANTKLKRSNDLSQWKNIFQLSGVNFVNLQYGDCASDIALVKKMFNVTLHDWDDSNPLLDLDDFSAKIKALDLVVSIDNSTVHMSGALGVPTWILQPYSPDWRWLIDDPGSYWYSSVKQYRQRIQGDWVSVIDAIASDLSTLSKN